jgi:hypothetical protein
MKIHIRKSPQKRDRNCSIFYMYEGRKNIGGVSACVSWVQGRQVFQVEKAFMKGLEYERRGFGTKLYEALAQDACERGLPLASSHRYALSSKSRGFWDKQMRKGRAEEIEYLDEPMQNRNVVVLKESCGSDLSELNLRSSWPWLAGAGAVALLALSSGKGGGGGSGLVATIQSWRQPPSDIRRVLQTAASKYGVPMPIMIGVAHTESRYDPKAGSRVGAQGLMQLMPRTAANLGVQDPWDAQQNAFGGAKFLSALKRQYGSWEKALAAYNWGQGNVTRNPSPGQWPQVTRNYVGNVLKISAEA